MSEDRLGFPVSNTNWTACRRLEVNLDCNNELLLHRLWVSMLTRMHRSLSVSMYNSLMEDASDVFS